MWPFLFIAFFMADRSVVAAAAEAGGGSSSSFSSSCELAPCGSSAVPYPFYYKPSIGNAVPSQCPKRHFQLYCINGELYFPLNLPSSSSWPQYRVLTFNSNSIVIDPLLPNCSEANVGDFTLVYQPHFSVSPGNYLQLYGCASCSNEQGCLNITGGQLPGNLLLACAPLYGNPCCQLVNPNPGLASQRIQDFKSFKHCTVLTSWALKSSPGLSVNVEIGLRLDWALPGECPGTCAPHAKCIPNIALKGYSCQCRSGYTGDGFLNGTSCTQVSCDKGWTIDNHGNCVEVATRWAGMAALVSGILGGATVLAGILIACALLRVKKNRAVAMRRRRSGEQLVDLLPIQWGSGSSCEVFSYKELERATKGFAAANKLGNGACGVVYSGRLVDGRMVAVKRIHYWNTQGLQQVVNEANVLSAAKHQNLVCLFGCCFEQGDPLLVFEYIANGTLAQHLQRERGQGLDWPTRLNVAAATADAIAYLHSFDPPIYHRDVKSSNILLDREFNAKVADFGLSRLVRDGGSHISTIPQGTPGYLDPEYHQNFHLSDKSDVYSFGVVLVEIISSLRAVDFSRDKKEVNLAALAVAKISAGKVDDIIDPFLLEGKIDAKELRASVHRLAELAFRCLAYDKDARPPMAEVAKEVGEIRWLISSINPPNLHLSDSSNCSSSSSSNTPSLHPHPTVVSSPPTHTLQKLITDHNF